MIPFRQRVMSGNGINVIKLLIQIKTQLKKNNSRHSNQSSLRHDKFLINWKLVKTNFKTVFFFIGLYQKSKCYERDMTI